MTYPQQQTANQLAQHGRYGDTMMMHVNPAEVAGIASLSPTGRLTKNPVTGQPEAFLPMLLPLLASYGGSALAAGAGASALGAGIAGGLASGAATAAITGDLERGLMSGIMGAGLGAAVGAAGSAGAEAAAGEALPDMLTGAQATEDVALGLTGAGDIGVAGTDIGVLGSAGMAPPAPAPDAGLFGSMDKLKDVGIGNALKAPFKAPEGQGMFAQVMKPRSMLPIAIGGGQLGQMNMQDAFNESAEELEGDRKERLKRSYGQLQGAYQAAQPGLSPGYSPYRSMMSRNTPGPMGYADGGIMRLARGGISGKPDRTDKPGGQPWWGGGNHPAPRQPIYVQGMADGGRAYTRSVTQDTPFGPEFNPFMASGGQNSGYQGIDPVAVQAGLRGQHSVAPPPGYMPGFSPEFNYFQNDPSNIQSPPVTNAYDWQQMYRDNPITSRMPNAPYFQSLPNTPPEMFAQQPPGPRTKKQRALKKPKKPRLPAQSMAPAETPEPPRYRRGRMGRGRQSGGGDRSKNYYAAGGDVMLNTATGPQPVAGGGIADIPTPMSQPPQPGPQDIQMVAAAITGQAPPEQATQIVEAFVQRFGPDVFAAVRQMILQQIQPGAQTQGMVQGPGGGMDDQVQGTIGAEQPVAVSPGEYIVPADVVSGLGDGSSDAGAAELDQMGKNCPHEREGRCCSDR
jgi:hypothetical protein